MLSCPLESVSYEFKGKGGVITYNYPEEKKPDTKVRNDLKAIHKETFSPPKCFPF
jgi:hypothetical protein